MRAAGSFSGYWLTMLHGAGGAGKTRLAIEVASQVNDEFSDGVWYVDLAPISNPALVLGDRRPHAGLAREPGRSTMDLLVEFSELKTVLLVLDNCEHLLDESGAIVVELLVGCCG